MSIAPIVAKLLKSDGPQRFASVSYSVPTVNPELYRLSATAAPVRLLILQAAILTGQRTDAADISTLVSTSGHAILLLRARLSSLYSKAAMSVPDAARIVAAVASAYPDADPEEEVLLASVHVHLKDTCLDFGMFSVNPQLQGIGTCIACAIGCFSHVGMCTL